MTAPVQNDFERAVSSQTGNTIIGDFWYFLRSSKKWWMTPILALLLLFGVLMLLGGTAAAPFIYTLF